MNKCFRKIELFLVLSVLLLLTACTFGDSPLITPTGAAATHTPTPTATMSPTPTNTPTPTSTPTPTPTPAPVTVTIRTIGDMLMHGYVIRSGVEWGTYTYEGSKFVYLKDKENRKINYDHFFTHVLDDIQSADLAVLNQETVLAGTNYDYYSGYPCFNSPTEIGDAEIKAGFDVILHANNHITDFDNWEHKMKGIEHTLEYWDTHPEVTVLGVNHSEEEYNTVKIVEIKGIKFALLNYTYGTNYGISQIEPWRINVFSYEKASADIAYARENADFIVVFPHWGEEYSYEPFPQEKKWAEFFVKEGVDLVVGNHAHVLQPIEWYEREDGHRTLVYYSLGNFVSSMNNANQMLNIMADVTITKAWDGEPYISEASAVPLVTHRQTTDKNPVVTAYKLAEYSDDIAKSHALRNASDPVTMKNLTGICRQVLKDWYSDEGQVVYVSGDGKEGSFETR